MKRFLFLAGAIALLATGESRGIAGQKQQKKTPNGIPPMLEKVINLSPKEFTRRFDKNKDGYSKMNFHRDWRPFSSVRIRTAMENWMQMRWTKC